MKCQPGTENKLPFVTIICFARHVDTESSEYILIEKRVYNCKYNTKVSSE